MGQPNDTQIIRQLTSDTLACRNPEWGWRCNAKRGIHLKRCPIIMSLVESGICTIARELNSRHTTYTVLRHTAPKYSEKGVPCPVCNGLVTHPPELSMRGHTKDCRLNNYYKASGAIIARK